MKCISFFWRTILVTYVVLLLFSCAKKTDTPTQTNEFIQYFLDHNSVTLYKSEIQRVKVNIFPATNMLVYSFWKKERFNINGDLYLHLYPSDSNDLIEPRRKYNFVNLPISNNGFFRGSPPYFYKFENLQLPYGLTSIQTGQYNKSGKTWKSDFKNHNSLNDEYQAKQALLSGKNSLYGSFVLKNESIIPFLGPKIYQSLEDGIKAVYYNVNLNRFTFLFAGNKMDKWENRTLFVNIHYVDQEVRRRVVSIDEIIRIDDLGMIHCDIPLNENFERLEFGKEEKGIETIWKSLEKKKLIYTSFPLKSSENAGKLKTKDNEIVILNNLIMNNIPLVYFNFDMELALYLNDKKNRAYIMSNNVDGFDSLKLESIIEIENTTLREEIRLHNSFFIKGESKQIVVHELKLQGGMKRTELLLNSEKKELFRQIIDSINN